MKAFDKENFEVSSEDCFRWSDKLIARMQQLQGKNQLTKEEAEEYRMFVLCANLLMDVGNDLLEEKQTGWDDTSELN
jgi:hypothetical protein